MYVRRLVGVSSALWQNGGSDPDAVWRHRSDGSRNEAGSGVWGLVHGKGQFLQVKQIGLITSHHMVEWFWWDLILISTTN